MSWWNAIVSNLGSIVGIISSIIALIGKFVGAPAAQNAVMKNLADAYRHAAKTGDGGKLAEIHKKLCPVKA